MFDCFVGVVWAEWCCLAGGDLEKAVLGELTGWSDRVGHSLGGRSGAASAERSVWLGRGVLLVSVLLVGMAVAASFVPEIPPPHDVSPPFFFDPGAT
jgi:hypothetical protein